jgi:peptidoglycan/xylan/chitin deacetylase (PgdA/CDA1 family)
MRPRRIGKGYDQSMLLLVIALLQLQGHAPPRTMAITIDDLPTASVLGNDIGRAERTTRDLLAAIGRTGVPAIGFVNERKLQPGGSVDPRRLALLQQWLDAGLELGNHTFSHLDLHQTDLEAFQQDVHRGDRVTKRLLGAKGLAPRFFRHPFLHTGRSRAVREGLHAFLKARGYTVAPVTVDNADYVFAAAYDRAAGASEGERARRIASSYLDYMEAVVGYYERRSATLVGREIAQTLLLHASALNASVFDALVERLHRRGYRFVPLAEALKDPAYASADQYLGPGGISWLHRWALTRGARGADFAGEPEVPGWVQEAAAGR